MDFQLYYLNAGSIMRGIQSTVMQVGKLVACFLAVYQVRQGSKSVGTFITLLTYWGELSGKCSLSEPGLGRFTHLFRTSCILCERAASADGQLTRC